MLARQEITEPQFCKAIATLCRDRSFVLLWWAIMQLPRLICSSDVERHMFFAAPCRSFGRTRSATRAGLLLHDDFARSNVTSLTTNISDQDVGDKKLFLAGDQPLTLSDLGNIRSFSLVVFPRALPV